MNEMTVNRSVVGLGTGVVLAGLVLLPMAGGASGSKDMLAKAHQRSFVRLGSTQNLPFNGIRLSPPPAGAKPSISATQAWTVVGRLPSGTFKIVLAEWHSTVPMNYSTSTKKPFLRGLVWIIEGKNIQVRSLGMGGGVHSENAIWPVNASTGQPGGELTY